MSFEGCTIRARTAAGAIRLNGAQIGGQLDCSSAIIINPFGAGLHGDRLKVNDNVFLCAGFTADGDGLDGAIRLVGAHIGGQLNCSNATITNPSGPALQAGALQVVGSVYLNAGFIAEGAGELGAVGLIGAHIGGQLDCSGAIITNASGPALHGERLRVDGDLFLRAGFTANGVSNLNGARIGGELDCSGATISNSSGPALHAANLQVGGNVLLRTGFTADGVGEWGAVRLSGARIGGQLDCSGATISNPSGPALRTGGLEVDRSVFLRAGFTANGAGKWGAVRLSRARIGGQLDCSTATITNVSGPALIADALQASSVILRAGFTANGVGERGTVRLFGARVGGRLDCSGAIVTSRSDPRHRWSLDGLTYIGLPLDPLGEGWMGWLHLFLTATPRMRPSPISSWHRCIGRQDTMPTSVRSSLPSAELNSIAECSPDGSGFGRGSLVSRSAMAISLGAPCSFCWAS